MKAINKTGLFLLLVTIFTSLFFINSCKKDFKLNPLTTVDSVSAARSWYESVYPKASVISSRSITFGNNISQKATAIANNKAFDYSQYTRPDWNHSASYKRFDKAVIEMPVDPSTNIASSLKNKNTGQLVYDKKNSKTSFLILNDGKGYKAFIMTIVADVGYINGDTTKLDKNTYRKRDAGFSGMVFYFTPNGTFLSSYRYLNGTLLTPATTITSTASAVAKTRAVSLTNKAATVKTQVVAAPDCIDWYFDSWLNGQLISEHYLYTVCGNDDGSGNTGGGAPPPCNTPATQSVALRATTRVVQPTDPLDPGDPGYPDPDPVSGTCAVPSPDTTKHPCQQMNDQSKNQYFIQLLNLLPPATNNIYEVGYTYKINDSGNIQANYFQGPNYQSKVDINIPSPIDGFLHTHYANDFPTFSGDDIQQIYNIMKSGSMANISTFTAGVVTASGTQYVIKISDESKFSDFGASNLVNNQDFQNFLDKYDNNRASFASANNDNITSYELALLSILDNSGLTLVKGNNLFNSWNAITNQNGQLVNTNCN